MMLVYRREERVLRLVMESSESNYYYCMFVTCSCTAVTAVVVICNTTICRTQQLFIGQYFS